MEHRIDDEPRLKEGEAKVKLHVMVPDLHPAPLTSRASEISNMMVMTFETSSGFFYMKDTPQPCIIEFADTPDESYFVATLNATTDPRLVVIVANASAALLSYTYTVDVTTLADVELFKTQALTTTVIGGTTYITQHPEIACMEGRVTLPSIQNGMIITDSSNPVPLTRGTAQIVVNSSSVPVTDLEILGASLCYAPLRGFIFPQSPIATSGEAHHHYTSSATTFLPFVGAESSGQKSEPLYCYEDSKDNGLFVILEANYKGVQGYYRINMVDGVLNDFDYDRHPIDIKRNTLYTVNIYKASNYGYTTITEAINNRASNIEYTVTAYVPSSEKYEDAHDIISNGDYFLGVSNSAFVSYSSGATGVIATTLTHNAPATVTTASISVSGTGLTLVTPSTGTFNPGDATKKLNVEVSMSAAFTTGTITIVLGTITKVVTVEQRPPIPFIAGVVNDFAIGNEHFTGMLIPEGGVTPNWLKFSTAADGSNGVEEIANLAGKIYIVHDHNIVMTGGSTRSGSVYITRDDEKGRVKALFNQPFLNADGITDNTPANVNTYVGAFWKANQTGERLIRIIRPTSSPTNVIDGQWTAVVLVGDSWIKLDKIPSSDAVWTSGGPAMNGNDIGFDAMHAVLGTATSLFGRVASAPNDEIYFRIGLRSTYMPTSTDPVRYGLVLLASAEGSLLQRIWIRQGEDPDYLMSPQDFGGGGQSWGTTYPRPDASKFSPYNLTATTMNAPVRNTYGTPPSSDQAAIFTLYPTQAGAYFQWANNSGTHTRYAYASIGSVTWSASFPSGSNDFWQGGTSTNLYLTHETCPVGYTLSDGATEVDFRRFNDGITDNSNSAGLITDSEVRQSLYLNPVTGSTGNGNPGNITWGYYADGFFDRQEIVTSPTATPNSAVSVVNNNIAYQGQLFYNRVTNASLFFPAAGFRIYSGSDLTGTGNLGYLWSSSSNTPTYSWYMAFYIGAAGMWTGTRANAYTIRCVVNRCLVLTAILLNASAGSATVGTPVTLTATGLTPTNALDVSYIWESYSAAGWTTIATTTTNSYAVPILNVGANTFRVTATNSCTSTSPTATTTVTGTPMIPSPIGGSAGRITWESPNATYPSGRYIITYDPRDAGLYFKYGGVVGVFSGDGAFNQNLLSGTNTSTFNAALHIPVNFTGSTINIWNDISYVMSGPIDAAFHNAANVKTGLGDPCRLVGLDLEVIKNSSAGSLTASDINNGIWRLPTGPEQWAFSGYTTNQSGGNPGIWWWDQDQNPTNFTLGVAGGEFPEREHPNGGPFKFLPAVGDRNGSGFTNFQRERAVFLTSTYLTGMESFHFAYDRIAFSSSFVPSYGWPVRCVECIAVPSLVISPSSVYKLITRSGMQNGQNVTFTATSISNAIYQWYVDGVVVQTGTSNTYTFVTPVTSLDLPPDSYTIFVEVTNSCDIPSTLSAAVTVQVMKEGWVRSTLTAPPYNGWIRFMYQNWGANTTMPIESQMSYSSSSATDATVFGDMYQWGRMLDGHEKRPSPCWPLTPSCGTDMTFGSCGDIVPDVNGQVPSSSGAFGRFIRCNNGSPLDWRTPQSPTLWNLNTDTSPIKNSVSDPCPTGWRVPTQTEWQSIFNGGTLNANGFVNASGNYLKWNNSGTVGWMFSPTGTDSDYTFFLPAGGYRDNNSSALKYVGGHLGVGEVPLGLYWSSATTGIWAYYTDFAQTGINTSATAARTGGFSIRCVAL